MNISTFIDNYSVSYTKKKKTKIDFVNIRETVLSLRNFQ